MTSVGRSVRTDGTGRVDQSWDEPTRRGSSCPSLSVVASSYFNRVLLLLLFAVDVLVWIRNVFLTGWAVQGSGGSGCLSLLIWSGAAVGGEDWLGRSVGRTDSLVTWSACSAELRIFLLACSLCTLCLPIQSSLQSDNVEKKWKKLWNQRERENANSHRGIPISRTGTIPGNAGKTTGSCSWSRSASGTHHTF